MVNKQSYEPEKQTRRKIITLKVGSKMVIRKIAVWRSQQENNEKVFNTQEQHMSYGEYLNNRIEINVEGVHSFLFLARNIS